MAINIGAKIRSLRQQNGLTQKELAARIGLTEASMSRYISGDRDPKPDVLANIATALQTTSDFLLGIENEDFSHARIRRMIARNASAMSEQEKRDLINALFGED